MSEETVQDLVIARASKDPAFRQALLSNPREVLAREYQVRVLEEPPNTVTLMLPAREGAVVDLSDEELAGVGGGFGGGGNILRVRSPWAIPPNPVVPPNPIIPPDPV